MSRTLGGAWLCDRCRRLSARRGAPAPRRHRCRTRDRRLVAARDRLAGARRAARHPLASTAAARCARASKRHRGDRPRGRHLARPGPHGLGAAGGRAPAAQDPRAAKRDRRAAPGVLSSGREILEVVQDPAGAPRPIGPARLWGLALRRRAISSDSVAALGDRRQPDPRRGSARSPDRERCAASAGLAIPVALISRPAGRRSSAGARSSAADREGGLDRRLLLAPLGQRSAASRR